VKPDRKNTIVSKLVDLRAFKLFRKPSLFLTLETPDVHDFGNPVPVPGPVGPKTGTACPTAITETPPWTISLF
jgi:hypothetical protein